MPIVVKGVPQIVNIALMLMTLQTTQWLGRDRDVQDFPCFLIPLSKTGRENASPNVVILPQHRPIQLSHADSGQDHDPPSERVAAFPRLISCALCCPCH